MRGLLLPLACAAALLPLRAAAESPSPASSGTLTGIDVLAAEGFSQLKGKRIALVSDRTGVDRTGRLTAALLASAEGVQLKAVFSPERGFLSGDVGSSSGTWRLPEGRVIPVSLLGDDGKLPASSSLSGLDALVFDLQGTGARFYPPAMALATTMEAAAARDIDFIVLDRPDPIGGDAVSGPVPDEGQRPPLAYPAVSVRHGMTIGELARLHNMAGRVGARLQVVPLRGWTRPTWFDAAGLRWTRPSPDLPDLEAVLLYPGIGCLEAANVSVGRGTPLPMRWVGAPWMDADAVLARLKSAGLKGYAFDTETLRPKHGAFKGRRCRGVRIRILDRTAADPLKLFAHIVCALRDLHPMEFGLQSEEAVRRVGTQRFLDLYRAGARPQKLIELFESDAARFKAWRTPFLLY